MTEGFSRRCVLVGAGLLAGCRRVAATETEVAEAERKRWQGNFRSALAICSDMEQGGRATARSRLTAARCLAANSDPAGAQREYAEAVALGPDDEVVLAFAPELASPDRRAEWTRRYLQSARNTDFVEWHRAALRDALWRLLPEEDLFQSADASRSFALSPGSHRYKVGGQTTPTLTVEAGHVRMKGCALACGADGLWLGRHSVSGAGFGSCGAAGVRIPECGRLRRELGDCSRR